MKELISKESAIDAAMKLMPSLTTPDGSGQFDAEIYRAQEMLVDVGQALQTLPPEHPKKAHWSVNEDGVFICSNCHEGYSNQPTLMGRPLFDYCPVCGASMEGGTDE